MSCFTFLKMYNMNNFIDFLARFDKNCGCFSEKLFKLAAMAKVFGQEILVEKILALDAEIKDPLTVLKFSLEDLAALLPKDASLKAKNMLALRQVARIRRVLQRAT